MIFWFVFFGFTFIRLLYITSKQKHIVSELVFFIQDCSTFPCKRYSCFVTSFVKDDSLLISVNMSVSRQILTRLQVKTLFNVSLEQITKRYNTINDVRCFDTCGRARHVKRFMCALLTLHKIFSLIVPNDVVLIAVT